MLTGSVSSTLAPETEAAPAANPGLAVAQKDTKWTKLFVGNHPFFNMTVDSLVVHFSKYGVIEEARVITCKGPNCSSGTFIFSI
jgi:hypothetical protein